MQASSSADHLQGAGGGGRCGFKETVAPALGPKLPTVTDRTIYGRPLIPQPEERVACQGSRMVLLPEQRCELAGGVWRAFLLWSSKKSLSFVETKLKFLKAKS